MAEAGYHVIGASTDFDSTDDGKVDGPYTVGVGATITEFWIYMGTTGGAKIRPLIYSDNAGEPNVMIATLTEISWAGTTGATWVGFSGLSIPVSYSAVWLGFWSNNASHRYNYDTPGGNWSRYKGTMATYASTGDAPTPWPVASDTTSTQKESVYVVYTPASTTSDVNVTGTYHLPNHMIVR